MKILQCQGLLPAISSYRNSLNFRDLRCLTLQGLLSVNQTAPRVDHPEQRKSGRDLLHPKQPQDKQAYLHLSLRCSTTSQGRVVIFLRFIMTSCLSGTAIRCTGCLASNGLTPSCSRFTCRNSTDTPAVCVFSLA